MIAIHDIFGGVHTVLPCTPACVDKHFELIKHTVPPQEVDEFKRRMLASVDMEAAYTMADGSCFIYYDNSNVRVAKGISMYGKGAPLEMLALFFAMFGKLNTQAVTLKFYPHSRSHALATIKQCKSLITLESIKKQSTLGHPLVIDIVEAIGRLDNLYTKRGVSCAVV